MPITEKGKLGKRLHPKIKTEIVRQSVNGRSQKEIASDFGVSPVTVRHTVAKSLGENWKRTFESALDPIADTIVKAATDQQDIHKAAVSGFKVFQGLGLLQGEQPQTVINVLAQLNQGLPGDLQFDLVSTSDLDTPQTLSVTEERGE